MRVSGFVVAMSLLGATACGPIVNTRSETVLGKSQETRVLGSHQLSPIESSWQVEADRFEGQLAFRKACVIEQTHTLTDQSVVETKSNTAAGVVWTSIGAAAVLTSIYFWDKASSLSDTPACADSSDDECSSPQERVRTAAVGMAVSGLSLGSYGVVELNRSPTMDVVEKGSRTKKSRGKEPVACAGPSALQGMKVAVQISETETLSGTVDAEGKARISVPAGSRAPVGVPLPVVATLIPDAASAYVRSGTVVGTITVSEQIADRVEGSEIPKKSADRRRPKRGKSVAAELGY